MKKKNQVQKLLLAKGHQNLSSSCVISGQCRTTISSSSGLSCLLTITVLKERERERWDEIAKIVCPSDIYLYYTRDIVILFQGWTWPLTLER